MGNNNDIATSSNSNCFEVRENTTARSIVFSSTSLSTVVAAFIFLMAKDANVVHLVVSLIFLGVSIGFGIPGLIHGLRNNKKRSINMASMGLCLSATFVIFLFIAFVLYDVFDIRLLNVLSDVVINKI